MADSGVEVIRADVLAGVPHGFLGARGGVGRGGIAGLNCGIGSVGPGGDDAASVAANRVLAAGSVLPGARLVSVYQVHSALCVEAGAWAEGARPHADALVTSQPGLLLSILTADCAPVLLADHEAGVVGAAHAGWKGAFAGVCEATIAAMVALGAAPARIAAAIGPCIAQSSYEVDEGFVARFAAQSAASATHFTPGRAGHSQFDLAGYVAARLRAGGAGRIALTGEDTYAQPARFYSFRRSTHRGEAAYGRQISLIGIAPKAAHPDINGG